MYNYTGLDLEILEDEFESGVICKNNDNVQIKIYQIMNLKDEGHLRVRFYDINNKPYKLI